VRRTLRTRPSRAAEKIADWTRKHTQAGLVGLILERTGERVNQSTVSNWARGVQPGARHILLLWHALRIPLEDWERPPYRAMIPAVRVRRTDAELIADGAGKIGAAARAEKARIAREKAEARAKKRASDAAWDGLKRAFLQPPREPSRAPARKAPAKTKAPARSAPKRRTGSE